MAARSRVMAALGGGIMARSCGMTARSAPMAGRMVGCSLRF